MRASIWMMVSVLALGAAGCSPKQTATPPKPAPAPAEAAAATPIPAAPPVDATAPPPAADASPAAAPEAAANPEAAEPPYHFSPSDYGKQERRIAALVANAETRDTLGETGRIAVAGERARMRCESRRCVEAAYAAEEAKLRKWEGSGDVR